MARVLIIGASKGIGFETTLQALEAGHQVRAPARSAAGIGLSDPKLEKVRGDALISKDIEAALNGIEVVIQTLVPVQYRTVQYPFDFDVASGIAVGINSGRRSRASQDVPWLAGPIQFRQRKRTDL